VWLVNTSGFNWGSAATLPYQNLGWQEHVTEDFDAPVARDVEAA